MRRLKHFLRNLRRLWYWLPVIWRDGWWDYCFLLQMIEAKLRWDADHNERDGLACDSDRRVRQMRVAAVLCERMARDEYTTPWDKEQHEEAERFFKCIDSHYKASGGKVMYSSEWYTPDPRNEMYARWGKEHAEMMFEQDLDYLCTLLRKHLRSWWD